MTADAMNSINEFRRRQLAEAGELVRRASQLCERVLLSMGDAPDPEVLKLQNDCAGWDRKWSDGPVSAVGDPESDYERAMG